MNKTLIFIGFAVCLLIVSGCKTENEFTEIEECIIDVPVIFSSEISVRNETDVLTVSNGFITWSKDNKNSTLWNMGTDWQIESVNSHGLYEGIKYWTVTYSYFSEQDQTSGKAQFDVNENGDLVLFLGCA